MFGTLSRIVMWERGQCDAIFARGSPAGQRRKWILGELVRESEENGDAFYDARINHQDRSLVKLP